MILSSGGEAAAVDGDDFARWKKIIEAAERKAEADRNSFDRFVEQFQAGQFPDGKDKSGGQAVTFNQTFAYVQMMMALLYAQAPAIEVDPREGSDAAAFAQMATDPRLIEIVGAPKDAQRTFSEAIELYLNYSNEDTQADDDHNVAIFEALTRGLAWTKVSYDPECDSERVDTLRRTEVYVDPHARSSMRQARYVIHNAVMQIDEAREFFGRLGVTHGIDPNWQLADGAGIEARAHKSDSPDGEKDQFKFSEIWKRGDKREILYIPHNGKQFLTKSDWPFTLHKNEFPFDPLCWNSTYTTMGDSFSELQIVEGLMQMRAETLEFFRRSVLRSRAKKVLLDSTVFDQRMAEQVMSAKHLEAIRIDKGNKGWKELVDVLNVNDGTDTSPEVAALFEEEANKVLGFDELQRSAAQKKLTATQAEIVDEYGKLRTGRRQKIVDNWQTRVLRKRAQIARQLVSPEKITKIVGEREGLLWSMYARNADDFLHDFSIGIQAGSTGERARQQKIERLKETLALVQNLNGARLAKQMPPKWDEDEVGLELLRAQNIRRPERFQLEEPTPQPMAGPGMPMPGAAPVDPNMMQDPNQMQPGAMQPGPVMAGAPAGPVPPGMGPMPG